MPVVLLETKFFVPNRRRGVVPRARLRQCLDSTAEATLTLVAAPASSTVAWLSLDQSDDDPSSFWTYRIAALQTVVPEVGAGALALLQSPQPTSIETVLTTVLNELGTIRGDVVLVLDDYH